MNPVSMILVYPDGSTRSVEMDSAATNGDQSGQDSTRSRRRKKCPHCGLLFHANGIGPHMKTCKAENETVDEAAQVGQPETGKDG